jgi:hypothetical protein
MAVGDASLSRRYLSSIPAVKSVKIVKALTSFLALCGGGRATTIHARRHLSNVLPNVEIDENVLRNTIARIKQNETDVADLLRSLQDDLASGAIEYLRHTTQDDGTLDYVYFSAAGADTLASK